VHIWRLIAERYRDERALVGYDLLNEPIAAYFDASTLDPLLEPLYKDLTRTIREVD
jgi:endoglucanase